MNKKFIGKIVFASLLMVLSSHAALVRYGQLGYEDGSFKPDVYINFAGGYATTDTATEAGNIGTSLHLAPTGTVFAASVAGGLALNVDAITGTTDERLNSNGAGSILGIRGTTTDRIDPGETLSISFNQNVIVKALVSHDAASVAVNVGGTSFDSSVAAREVLSIDQALTAGQTITLGSASGAWRVRALYVETVPEPATLGLVALFGGGVLFLRRTFMV